MKLKFKILGKDWTLKAMDKATYKKKNGKRSIGMTHIHKRQIHVRPHKLLHETIIHELVHAYLAELCVYSASLSGEELEEVFCDLLAKYGIDILDLSIRLERRILAE